jgi:hypothetical protein
MPPDEHLECRLIAISNEATQKLIVAKPTGLGQAAGLPQSLDQLMQRVGHESPIVASTIKEVIRAAAMR